MNKKKKWGGKRENSGRKCISENKKLKTQTFMLSEKEMNLIKNAPGKSNSEKLRNILCEYSILKNPL